MPEGYKGWVQKADHLTAPEIIRVVEAATQTGFTKFRLTGGEPLLRDDLVEIVKGIRALKGVRSLDLSTNGLKLAALARQLKDAGVDSVNVSLDALTPEIYRKITGGIVERVLDGIQAAREAGFDSLKLNCVLMRGINEGEILPLVAFAGEIGMPLRFIELMPLTNKDVLSDENFFPVEEAMQLLSKTHGLTPIEEMKFGNGPARYFRLTGSGAIVGFIGAVTTPDFCESCNKLRLTSDGKLRPCLGRHGEIDLIPTVRGGGDLQELFAQGIQNKPENHEFTSCYEPGRPMTAIGG
jgi:cyclic pyranopterin phosphate synthase